jgi:hypothetical protein
MWNVGDQAPLEARVELAGPHEPRATTSGGRWSTATRLKAFVLFAAFVLMASATFSDGADLVFDLLVAVVWTAVLAGVWELAARALARARHRPHAHR